jgi:hypothetical protein
MTWFKNNLWALIIGIFGGFQVTLLTLKWIGAIQWNSTLVLLPTLILIGVTLFLIGCIILFNLDDFDDLED